LHSETSSIRILGSLLGVWGIKQYDVDPFYPEQLHWSCSIEPVEMCRNVSKDDYLTIFILSSSIELVEMCRRMTIWPFDYSNPEALEGWLFFCHTERRRSVVFRMCIERSHWAVSDTLSPSKCSRTCEKAKRAALILWFINYEWKWLASICEPFVCNLLLKTWVRFLFGWYQDDYTSSLEGGLRWVTCKSKLNLINILIYKHLNHLH
jgi:hypothetical protein